MIKFVMRHLGAAGQFMRDVKIGYDLGYDWPTSISFAWKIWGWQTACS